MRMNLQIKEVVLRGVAIKRSDLPAFQAAINEQLTQRMRAATEEGHPADIFADQARLDFAPCIDPVELASDVADSICPMTYCEGGGDV